MKKAVLTVGLAMIGQLLTAQVGNKWKKLVGEPQTKDTTTTSIKDKDAAKLAIQPFSKVIPSTAQKKIGLFTTYRVGEKYYFEIPDSLLGRDMMVITRFTRTPVGLKEFRAQYGGEMINDQLWQWERRANTIYLRVPDYTYIGAPGADINQALDNSNVSPILAAFPIKARSQNNNGTLIDVSDFYQGDIPGMNLPEALKKTYKIGGIDAARSYIDTMKTFPINIEVCTVKTFRSTDLPADKTVGAMTFGLNTSMILLPKEAMAPRLSNDRVGYFVNRKVDFAVNDQKVTPRAYIQRWRLEPTDAAAYARGELVQPKKQIVYYIDPATPKKWVPYLIQGVNDWNVAFQAAGFKDAIIAKEAPSPQQDPEFSTEDARYSVIRYFASETENAYGPRVSDPRSGEIIESHIGWYHNVMSLLKNWFFVQTAAIHEGARGSMLSDKQMGELIRFVSSHEVGHTLGLLHNFGSSYAYDVDSLRSKTFTDQYGTAPSIMDYARFNYIAQPGDGVTNIYPKIGTYDQYAIRFGYQYLGHKTLAEQEQILLKQVQEKQNDPAYFYGPQGSIDPRAQSEDLGNDAVKASTYGIANLKRIVPNIELWNFDSTADLSQSNEIYLEVFRQFRRYVNHVLANVAGLLEDPKTMGESGSVYRYVAKDKQKAAVRFIAEQVFVAPKWLLADTLMARYDYGIMVNKISEMQNQVLTTLLETYGFARMLDDEFKNGDQAYTVRELLSDVRQSVFNQPASDIFARNVQRSFVDRLGVMSRLDKPVAETKFAKQGLSPFNPNLSDMRIYIQQELKETQRIVKKQMNRSRGEQKRHYEDLNRRLKKLID